LLELATLVKQWQGLSIGSMVTEVLTAFIKGGTKAGSTGEGAKAAHGVVCAGYLAHLFKFSGRIMLTSFSSRHDVAPPSLLIASEQRLGFDGQLLVAKLSQQATKSYPVLDHSNLHETAARFYN